MANFMRAIEKTLGHEGGYINHPNDKGGETNWGITIAVARANGYKDKIKDMSREVAIGFYKLIYWDKLNLDKVNNQAIAEIIFDLSVNTGISSAGKKAQEMINFMTKEKDIEVDGDIGSITLRKLNDIDTSRERELAILLLTFIQGEHYLNCMRNREENEAFALGWLRRAKRNMELISYENPYR